MGLVVTPGRHHEDGTGVIRHMRGMRPSRPVQADRRKMMLVPPGVVFAEKLFLIEMDQVVLRDQGSLGCCVGMTYAECVDQNLARKDKLTADAETSGLDAYDVARIAGGTPLNEDSGSTSSDMCEGARMYGVTTEKVRPFSDDESEWSLERSAAAVADALTRQLELDLACPTPESIKHSLTQGFSVMTGFTCFPSLMSPHAASTGEIPMPKANEREIGGHEMLVCGWDDSYKIGDNQGVWILRNHWSEWGARYGKLKGYGLLPYAYLEHRLMNDSRCPRLFEIPA